MFHNTLTFIRITPLVIWCILALLIARNYLLLHSINRTMENSRDDIIKFVYFGCLWIFICSVVYFYLPLGARAVAIDTFRIPTESMEPTLIPGDKVMVNKLIFGVRWYTDLDSVSTRSPQTVRLSGLRELKHNDIVVFNMPYPYSREKIEFRINYVFCKRCVGLPGDSISIRNGFYRNSNSPDTLGYISNQRRLSRDRYRVEQMQDIFPHDTSYRWNALNFGPLYIPHEGNTITIDTLNYVLYKLPIEFETRMPLRKTDGVVTLGGEPIDEYTFTKNYYFMAGDNVLNSQDSRSWGFVPEEHIVGVVTHVIYSFSGEGRTWNWRRFLRSARATF